MCFTFQPGSSGGGAVKIAASHIVQVDGLLDVSAAPATNKGTGGGSAGSILIQANLFLGKGRILAEGGEAVDASFGDGGGGAGGRVAVHFESSRFAGTFSAHGGYSGSEAGGPGTVYLAENSTHRTMIIDNNGYRTSKAYISDYRDTSKDGGRAWINVEYRSEFTIEQLYLRGGGHLALRHLSPTFTLHIERLDGDLGGMLHASKGNRVYVRSAPTHFPASFNVYDLGFLHLPPNVLLKDLYYPRIAIEGTVSGMDNLVIGGGSELVSTEKVRSAFRKCLEICTKKVWPYLCKPIPKMRYKFQIAARAKLNLNIKKT